MCLLIVEAIGVVRESMSDEKHKRFKRFMRMDPTQWVDRVRMHMSFWSVSMRGFRAWC